MGKLYFYYQYAPDEALTRHTDHAELGDALHMIRDREIYSYMILRELYDYAGSILNPPPGPFRRQATEIPLDIFGIDDLILLNTRPPVLSRKERDNQDRANPFQEFEQRHIAITGQTLEQIMLNNLGCSAFDRCGRKSIQVREELFDNNQHAPYFAPKFRFVVFYISPRRCWVEKMGPNEDQLYTQEKEFTLGYIVYLPNLSDGIHDKLPGLLNIFSIGGTASILFSILVYQQYANMIRKMISAGQSRLVMVKFSFHFDDYRKYLPPFLESVPIEHEIVNDFTL